MYGAVERKLLLKLLVLDFASFEYNPFKFSASDHFRLVQIYQPSLLHCCRFKNQYVEFETPLQLRITEPHLTSYYDLL